VSDRMYRGVLGAAILIALYFELQWMMLALIGFLFLEGITNQRLPKIVCKIRNSVTDNTVQYVNSEVVTSPRFNVESERVWRVVVGLMLLVSFVFIETLWWFPWFMGFAIFGAGLSGVCPVLLGIRWTGFK